MRNWSKAKRRKPGFCECPAVPCSSSALVGGKYCQYCREHCLPDVRRRRRGRWLLAAVIVVGPLLAMLATWMLVRVGI